MYYWNKENKIHFYYSADAMPIDNTPSIYLFDTFPNLTDAKAGNNSIQTISAWTDSDRELAKIFTLSAVNDPDPLSATYYKEYFIAINYLVKTSGTILTKIQTILMLRAPASIKRHNVTIQDLKKCYPAIEKFISDEDLEGFLSNGVDEIKLDFQKNGISWEKIADSNNLKWAIIYKALANSQLAEFTDPTSKEFARYEIYEGKYREAIKGDVVTIDEDQDGKADHKASTNYGFSINIK